LAKPLDITKWLGLDYWHTRKQELTEEIEMTEKTYQATLILSDNTAIPVSARMSAEAARAEVDRIKNDPHLNRHAEAAGGWYEVR
jgi:hypothetical protein